MNELSDYMRGYVHGHRAGLVGTQIEIDIKGVSLEKENYAYGILDGNDSGLRCTDSE